MNDTRNRLYSWITAFPVRCAVLVCFGSNVLNPLIALADVGLPPPAQHQNAGFPSDQALQRRGYDPKTGIWKVDVQNNGKPTVRDLCKIPFPPTTETQTQVFGHFLP